MNEVFAAWHQGDAEALAQVHSQYDLLIRATVRRKLSRRLQHRVDFDDMVQIVYTKLIEEGSKKLLHWDNAAAFTAWLIAFTIKQVLKQIRYETALRRHSDRECPLAECDELGRAGSHEPPERGSRDVEKSCELRELIVRAMRPDDVGQQRMVALLAVSHSREEIARQTGVTTKTVWRKLDDLRDRLREMNLDFDREVLGVRPSRLSQVA